MLIKLIKPQNNHLVGNYKNRNFSAAKIGFWPIPPVLACHTPPSSLCIHSYYLSIDRSNIYPIGLEIHAKQTTLDNFRETPS